VILVVHGDDEPITRRDAKDANLLVIVIVRTGVGDHAEGRPPVAVAGAVDEELIHAVESKGVFRVYGDPEECEVAVGCDDQGTRADRVAGTVDGKVGEALRAGDPEGDLDRVAIAPSGSGCGGVALAIDVGQGVEEDGLGMRVGGRVVAVDGTAGRTAEP
jgi:hypothetical protein